nr:hypothetical protein [Paraburkholderia sp. BL10I2N1]
MSDKGRAVVVDGDSVLCPCGKNRVIVGSNPGIFLNTDRGSAVARNAASAAQSAIATGASVATYDEQVRAAASGGALDGYPYFVETADGRTFSGRVGANGLLPRIETDVAGTYAIYWGDEALARRVGA